MFMKAVRRTPGNGSQPPSRCAYCRWSAWLHAVSVAESMDAAKAAVCMPQPDLRVGSALSQSFAALQETIEKTDASGKILPEMVSPARFIVAASQ